MNLKNGPGPPTMAQRPSLGISLDSLEKVATGLAANPILRRKFMDSTGDCLRDLGVDLDRWSVQDGNSNDHSEIIVFPPILGPFPINPACFVVCNTYVNVIARNEVVTTATANVVTQTAAAVTAAGSRGVNPTLSTTVSLGSSTGI